MKAVILAAGYATRLYPMTLDTPKALLTIGKKPILDYIVDEINTVEDVDKIYIVSNHRFADDFLKWAEKRNNKIEIKVLDDGTLTEETKKGAVGDILFAVEQESIDDDLMVIAGDNFFTYKLKTYYEYFKTVGKDCVCVKRLADRSMLKHFGVAVIDENNKVVDFEEKKDNPKSDNVVYAAYLYLRETVPLFKKYIDEGNKPDAPGYFIQWLYRIKDLFAYEIKDGDCFDIGTHKAYDEIRKMF